MVPGPIGQEAVTLPITEVLLKSPFPVDFPSSLACWAGQTTTENPFLSPSPLNQLPHLHLLLPRVNHHFFALLEAYFSLAA